MSDEWMPSLQLNLTPRQFAQLPRHPAYQYHLAEGVAHIAPWPRHAHATLDLTKNLFEAKIEVQLRHAEVADLEALVGIFRDAFGNLQPFGSLDAEEREAAARRSLLRTFTGGDGPMVDAASFVGVQERRPIGAILITLLPGGDPAERDSYHWQAPPPDPWQRREGQPHLTWIFVDRAAQRHGLGTQLLHASAHVLRAEGYPSLWTTFLIGNDSSALWHWRNGFTLVPSRT